MKVGEVPQEDANAFEQEFKVIQYAVNEEGTFEAVKSVGWNPKTIVMQNALDYESQKAEAARELVEQGKRSELYYHARKNMMTSRILSGYTGINWLAVKLHFYPCMFRRLSKTQLKKYADAFGYASIDELFKIDTP